MTLCRPTSGFVHCSARSSLEISIYTSNQHLSTIKAPLQTQSSRLQSKKSEDTVAFRSYNDDAFGLVFISSVVQQDFTFSGSFLLLSALAAAYTNTVGWSERRLVLLLPTAVVSSTWILNVLVSSLVPVDVPPPSPMALVSNVIVTLVSIGWCLYQSRREKGENEL